MADLLKIAAIGILTAVCVLILRDNRSDVALLIGITGGIMILLSLVEYFSEIFSFFNTLVDSSGIDGGVIRILLKIVGVGYIAEISAGIIEETGAKAVAEKVALGGKLVILSMTIPIIKLLFDIISGMLA